MIRLAPNQGSCGGPLLRRGRRRACAAGKSASTAAGLQGWAPTTACPPGFPLPQAALLLLADTRSMALAMGVVPEMVAASEALSVGVPELEE